MERVFSRGFVAWDLMVVLFDLPPKRQHRDPPVRLANIICLPIFISMKK
jgi:hypothetical protein